MFESRLMFLHTWWVILHSAMILHSEEEEEEEEEKFAHFINSELIIDSLSSRFQITLNLMCGWSWKSINQLENVILCACLD